jgi:hypothetical protein
MTTRAKFRVDNVSITQQSVYDKVAQAVVKKEAITVLLHPVVGTSKENEEFYASTPSGEISLDIINLPAAIVFKPGREIYVDFTATDEPYTTPR